MLTFIHKQLEEILGRGHNFLEILVVFVGDLFQLKQFVIHLYSRTIVLDVLFSNQLMATKCKDV